MRLLPVELIKCRQAETAENVYYFYCKFFYSKVQQNPLFIYTPTHDFFCFFSLARCPFFKLLATIYQLFPNQSHTYRTCPLNRRDLIQLPCHHCTTNWEEGKNQDYRLMIQGTGVRKAKRELAIVRLLLQQQHFFLLVRK